ncbi:MULTISPECIES: hypothetical protein [Pseudomonas]|uniref:hypothetical protein n=1 Tax=Pseudomonas TaxID=286 RepID=UPI001C00729E|nr:MULTISPECIES: hypothetical protein [Pseudomonas]MBT9303389.1 hypothetical protein [Pseudomonas sp. TAE6080]|tara:strand:- start:552 stop:746 length:195 start_codon:yes stop_codon:yes gene_type:complete
MTTTNLNLFNAGQLVDSVASHIADQLNAQEKPKQPQTETFSFNGVEYSAAPKPRNTLIPTPRIG